MALTDTKIRKARPKDRPYKLTDSGGLYIEVTTTGSKLWRYRYRIDGKENVYAIGHYSDTSLEDAREERNRARKLVKEGIHPSHQRKTRRLKRSLDSRNTFESIAKEWIDLNRDKWSASYLRQVEKTFEGNVYSAIGDLPIKSVTAAHLLAILKKVEKRGAHTVAILLRQWFSAIFRYAVSTLRAENDPAAALKGSIVRPKVQHHKPLARKDIPAFFESLDNYGGHQTTIIALRLLMYLFVRPVELRAAEWTEFDLENAEWRIPAHRMKMGEQHIVPLPAQAVELLKQLHELTGGRKLLFPNYRRPKTCMTITTMNRALERMGYAGQFSSHGFRATASTMLNEMGYRPDVIERQLAHKERNATRRSYNQAEYLQERRQMMQHWADYLDGLKQGGDVVNIKTAG